MPLGTGVLDPFLEDFAHVARARELAQDRIQRARTYLAPSSVAGLDVVAFGSLARGEVTQESDFDYLVLASQLPDDPHCPVELLAKANELRKQWALEEGHLNTEVRPPGTSGVFGLAVGAFDLVDQIGLQQDTNHSLTRRMLLLEESVSLLNEDVHTAVLTAALRRYLEVGKSQPSKVPRFLLNDVTRYWRTITVDYQAKARFGQDASGLRYLKLIIPRKILFAGTVMSLLLCGKDEGHRATVADLVGQFRLTALERLVQGYRVAPADVQDAMRGIVSVLDYFLEQSADPSWRAGVKSCSKGEPDCSPFEEMCARADDLQTHLETVFFGWDLIAESTRRTLVF